MADIFLRPLDQFLKRCSFWKSNYRSQVKLQESALDHLREDTEKRSMAVSYFCSERKNDLNSLASNRAISAFFENKALGMSMEYELRASLLDLISAKTGKIDQFEVVNKYGVSADILAIRAPVQDTPLSLVTFLATSEVFGPMAPWHLPMAMGALAIILLGGMCFAFRINMQKLILHTQLEEASKMEQEIEEKNDNLAGKSLFVKRQRRHCAMRMMS
ncbi:MAG: hypothetical protein JRJ77_18090 [Deltaproteobacteria bacterium]|nr:hypothetical protein [Deltaproteobacteria bacterium]